MKTTLNKDLKRMGLIAKSKAYKEQIVFAQYLYVFLTGILFGAFFV